mgnify:CR=1 FL=1
MPSHKQGTTEAATTEGSLGTVSGLSTSDTNRMQSLFPGSPIHLGQMTREQIREYFKTMVLSGVINDGGHTFGEHNTAFSDSPNIDEVETGAEGLPASPHVPNPVSPGVGSNNAGDQAAAPDGFGTKRSDTPGSGQGSKLQPSESSEKVSKQDIDNLTLGKGS